MDAVQYLDKAGHIQTHPNLLWGLATCHAISTSEAGGLVGNQVEVNMFSSTGWQLIETSGQAARVEHAGQRLTIVRVNQFEHARRSMSVVALDESTGKLHVFCKVTAAAIPILKAHSSVHTTCMQLQRFVTCGCTSSLVIWQFAIRQQCSAVEGKAMLGVYTHLLVQGSFERMGEIVCQESVPSDYLQTGEEHASDGCYVLAMAHRSPPAACTPDSCCDS